VEGQAKAMPKPNIIASVVSSSFQRSWETGANSSTTTWIIAQAFLPWLDRAPRLQRHMNPALNLEKYQFGSCVLLAIPSYQLNTSSTQGPGTVRLLAQAIDQLVIRIAEAGNAFIQQFVGHPVNVNSDFGKLCELCPGGI
jgi:hypothetical protein